MAEKIISFTQLTTWQKAYGIVIDTYKITRLFPNSERFCLIDQMRRAAISITSNIAEGFSRQSKKEKIQFYFISFGSTSELLNQFMLAKDLSFITKSDYDDIADKMDNVQRLLQGLIKSVKTS